MKVRVYGPKQGYHSFARVAHGAAWGLERQGALAGLFANDETDLEDNGCDGFDADVAVYFGQPAFVNMMRTAGRHRHRLILLPPNSTWMPEELVERLELDQAVTGYIAPSQWAEDVMRTYTKLPVLRWAHGVHEGFQASEEDRYARWSEFASDRFRVLHMTSSRFGRKGTHELLEAWMLAVSQRILPERSELHVVHDMPSEDFHRIIQDAAGANGRTQKSVIGHRRLPKMDPEGAGAFLRRFHLVAQPSRGEGFGMVPLEARACGVPVLMTTATGHSEHTRALFATGPTTSWPIHEHGVVAIRTGAMAPLDDGPNGEGMAPSLNKLDVYDGLVFACEMYSHLAKEAFRESSGVGRDWSWIETTRAFLRRLHELDASVVAA